MLFIHKGPAPIELRRWLAKNKEILGANLRFADCPKDAIRCALLKEQHYLCAYTMKAITIETCHIEHFHPQSSFPNETTDYRNLLGCWPKQGYCSFGAQAKGDSSTVICNPTTAADVEGAFRFTPTGKIKGLTQLAQTTIDVLHLNAPELIAERRAAIEGALGIGLRKTHGLSIKQAKLRIQELSDTSQEHFEPFCLAIAQVLERKIHAWEGRSQRLKRKP